MWQCISTTSDLKKVECHVTSSCMILKRVMPFPKCKPDITLIGRKNSLSDNREKLVYIGSSLKTEQNPGIASTAAASYNLCFQHLCRIQLSVGGKICVKASGIVDNVGQSVSDNWVSKINPWHLANFSHFLDNWRKQEVDVRSQRSLSLPPDGWWCCSESMEW